MTLKDLINKINKKDFANKEILFSNDEELNCLHAKGQIAYLKDLDKFVIYPLSGTKCGEIKDFGGDTGVDADSVM